MKTHSCLPSFPASLRSIAALAVAAGVCLSTSAQTATHHTPVHHTAAASGGCVRMPEISPTVPALPASAPCVKALYTITNTPQMKLDYVSPLVSPQVRDSIDQKTQSFSLLYVDTAPGTGELIRPSTYLSVKYTGYLADGKKFDSSDDHANKEPITFQHGEHRVIQGWDTGFEGMRVGGKRRLIIPYELAYGEAGRPPVIPAKATLIFDVEVVAQSDKAPEPPKAAARPMPPLPHPPTPAAGTHPAVFPAAKTPPPASTSTPPNSTAPKP